MSADYCRSLIRETPTDENKKQEKMKLVFNEIFSNYNTIYTNTVHYLTLYIVIRNQHITFL